MRFGTPLPIANEWSETMTRYRLNNGLRTGSEAEYLVAQSLIERGYTVLKRGWPDFVAVRGKQIRFIEVKRDGAVRINKKQRPISDILEAAFGMKVEMLRPKDVGKRLGGKEQKLLEDLHEGQ